VTKNEQADLKTVMALAVREAYQRHEEDEALEPLALVDAAGNPIGRMKDGDYVIFYDIRGEREVELTQSLIDDGFDEFPTVKGMGLKFVTMIEYDKKLDVKVAFPPLVELKDTFSEVISNAGLKQVKIVESEKSVHLGFFLNGKRKEPFSGEERLTVPTLKDVVSFDKKPEMSIKEVAQQIIKRLGRSLVLTSSSPISPISMYSGTIENEEAIKKAVACSRQGGRKRFEKSDR